MNGLINDQLVRTHQREARATARRVRRVRGDRRRLRAARRRGVTAADAVSRRPGPD
ncbi:MAG: hypothetical protein GXX79_08005 [Actinomycetales bacterium]|nr:hypothetical protein [Actinomycetales bacterium]